MNNPVGDSIGKKTERELLKSLSLSRLIKIWILAIPEKFIATNLSPFISDNEVRASVAK